MKTDLSDNLTQLADLNGDDGVNSTYLSYVMDQHEELVLGLIQYVVDFTRAAHHVIIQNWTFDEPPKKKVACIGDSLTEGFMTDSSTAGWPARLQAMLTPNNGTAPIY